MIPPLAIIQARIHSTRLPRKMLLPIGGRPLVWHAWHAACGAFGKENVVVACPITDVAEFADALLEATIFGWEGPENDVLSRLYACARKYRSDPRTVIFRVTPDDFPPVLYRDHWRLSELDWLQECIGETDSAREHVGHLMPTQGGLEINTAEDLEKARKWYE